MRGKSCFCRGLMAVGACLALIAGPVAAPVNAGDDSGTTRVEEADATVGQSSDGVAVEGKEGSKDSADSGDVLKVGEVTVTGKIGDSAAENIPAVVETLTAEGIERINAVDTSDVFKYMPGSYLRKLYPGSNNRPLVIRGNSSALTARTEVLMDGVRISDFLAAGHSNSPKWYWVAPDEIDQVEMVYGPYSAELSGNSLSGTAMITTHFPQKMEATGDVQYMYQNYHEYNTDLDINGFNGYVSGGDKVGDLSFLIWYNRLQTDVNPIQFQTKAAADGGSSKSGTVVTGWTQDKDPSGNPRYILGSYGEQDLVNNTFKVKLAYDLTPYSQVRFFWSLLDAEQNYDSPETYLRDSNGNPVYSGKVIIDGKSYTLASNTFTYNDREWQDAIYGLTYSLNAPNSLKVNAVVSAYDKSKDLSYLSSGAPTSSSSSGAGTVTDNDGNWWTADLKASYDVPWYGTHTVGAGWHFDHYYSDTETWNASNWKDDVRTTLSEEDEGSTQTNALFVEDTWQPVEKWSVYLGGRYEWWDGFDGEKSTDTGAGRVTAKLEDKSEDAFSPKFSTSYSPTENWRLRISLARAVRFPTIGELYYGGINSQGYIIKSNPDLKSEKSFSKDFTITRFIGKDGEARLTFFEDDVDDAIASQTNYYTNVTNFQNVDEVRTRGVELALNKRRFLIDGLGIFTNVAWTDAEIVRNDNVPDSVGKTFPRVPEWRVKCVLDYAPTEHWFLTFAAHYSSKQYGTLDNSDDYGGYGGVDDFLVFDTKFSYKFLKNLSASIGVDNLTDESYHVSHPYPRRTYIAELKYQF